MFVFREEPDGFLNQFELLKKEQPILDGQDEVPAVMQEVQADS